MIEVLFWVAVPVAVLMALAFAFNHVLERMDDEVGKR